MSVSPRYNVPRHLIALHAFHFDPIAQSSGLQSVRCDASSAVGIFEWQVAQGTQKRCLAGSALTHNKQSRALPKARRFTTQ